MASMVENEEDHFIAIRVFYFLNFSFFNKNIFNWLSRLRNGVRTLDENGAQRSNF
jgi:hypothetical protein